MDFTPIFTIPDAIYMAARDGTILAINHTALVMFEYSQNELIQLQCGDLYADRDQHRMFQQVIEKDGFVKDFEARMQTKRGSRIECLVTAHVLTDNSGDNHGVQGIIRDITEKNAPNRRFSFKTSF